MPIILTVALTIVLTLMGVSLAAIIAAHMVTKEIIPLLDKCLGTVKGYLKDIYENLGIETPDDL